MQSFSEITAEPTELFVKSLSKSLGTNLVETTAVDLEEADLETEVSLDKLLKCRSSMKIVSLTGCLKMNLKYTTKTSPPKV